MPVPRYGSNQVDELAALEKLTGLDRAFRPGAPVTTDGHLAGRDHQRAAIAEAVRSPAQHVVVGGGPGVGKTSLAVTGAVGPGPADRLAVTVTCERADTFHDIWRKFADECAIHLADRPDHTEDLEMSVGRAMIALDRTELAPADARLALHHLLTASEVVVVVDDFHETRGSDAPTLMSELVSALSRRAVPVTIVIVGTSDDTASLLGSEPAAARWLRHVHVPRMPPVDLASIAQRGLASLGMHAEPDVWSLIETVPKGLPRYAHLLARAGARRALARRSLGVTVDDVVGSFRSGTGGLDDLDRIDPELWAALGVATTSVRRSRFGDVLLACALTGTDGSGYFAPADVRPAYSLVTGRAMDIPNFNPHLSILSQERGVVLERTGEEWRRRYRFARPEMAPLVLLHGLADGRIAPHQIVGQAGARPPSGRLFEIQPAEPAEPAAPRG